MAKARVGKRVSGSKSRAAARKQFSRRWLTEVQLGPNALLAQGSCSPSAATLFAAVESSIAAAWTASNPNAPAVPPNPPPSQKTENGGWVIVNCVTNAYRVVTFGPGTRDSVTPGPKPTVSAPERVVGMYHTHPNTVAEGYSPGPSPADTAFVAANQVAGHVRSHAGDFIF